MRVAATLSVCADCIAYLANGPDDIEAERLPDILAGIAKQGGDCAPGSDDNGFSWSPCDLCESPLGGDRYGAAVLVPESVA